MRPGVLFILYLGFVLWPLALAAAGERAPRRKTSHGQRSLV